MNLVPCAKTGGALPLVIEAQEWLKARSFSASNFKREYLQCKEPRLIEHVQTQLDTFLHGCATKVIIYFVIIFCTRLPVKVYDGLWGHEVLWACSQASRS